MRFYDSPWWEEPNPFRDPCKEEPDSPAEEEPAAEGQDAPQDPGPADAPQPAPGPDAEAPDRDG